MTTNSNARLGVQENVLSRNTFQALRSAGVFAKWPIIGITLFLVGSLTFGAIAYGVRPNGPLLPWDTATAKSIHAGMQTIPSSLVEYVIFGFFIGREIIIILGTILAVYFLHKHFWREFAMILLGPGVGGLLWYFLSRFFERPRPTTQLDIVLSDPSFPSGHALSAVVFYGLLAYLLVPRMPSRFWKWFVIIMLTLVTVFVGLSRILLGGHYVTDVIAGYAVGFAWAGLVYTLIESLFGEKTDQVTSQSSQPSEGLRSPGVFKKWPMVGFLMLLLGGLSLAALGYNLLNQGLLTQWDVSIYKDLIVKAKQAPPRLNELMTFGFFMGKQVILVMVTILSIYFLYKRYWRELGMLLISSAGGSFVWNFFISYFNRPRPPDQMGLVIKTIPSFPSGHAMSAVICYGFLAYLLVPKMPSLFWKWTLIIITLLVVLLDGFSRVFQGSHYLTDVLAGYALGVAWAGLVCTIIEGIFMKRKLENVEKK